MSKIASPLKKKNYGNAGPPKIASRLRYDPKSAVDLTAEALAFGTAMAAYLHKWDQKYATSGMILDVALDIGYQPPEHGAHDFRVLVGEFESALRAFKTNGWRPIRFPAWSEILGVMTSCGWTKPTPAPPAAAPQPAA